MNHIFQSRKHSQLLVYLDRSEEICFTRTSLTIILSLKGMQTEAGVPNNRDTQMLSAAEMYLNIKFVISEMWMVSLMVVSLLRT